MSACPKSPDTPATLLVDIGNTHLKWAWLEGGRISAVESGAHRPDGVVALAGYSWAHAQRPGRVVVANVAGQGLANELEQWTTAAWGIAPEFVTAAAEELGVRNAYRQPGRLGVDRWLALIGARDRTREAVCVVDCGTAITIDMLAADGRHLGGLILPGLAMMRDALIDRTQISQAGMPESTGLLAQDTAGAIAAGGLHAAAALVERVVTTAAEQGGATPRLILTGGDARRLKAVLNPEAVIDPELVMRGLALVAQSR